MATRLWSIGRRTSRRLRPVGFAALMVLSTAGFSTHQPPDERIGALDTSVTEMVTGVLAGLPAPEPVPVADGEALKGLFRVSPANCSGGSVSGTYFRMIQPGGSANGPFIENNSSRCADRTYTDLHPGADGGLSTVDYQPHPSPAFDAGGNGVANRILAPQAFFGRNFAVATNATDPQTGGAAPVPTVTHDGQGGLSGNLSAFAAAYGGQHFNQGAPKPDGSNPGNTSGPTGNFDPATGRFTLTWSSTIVGGPFNNFTGQWHFEGTFEPEAAAGTDDMEGPDPGNGGDGGSGLLPLPLPFGQPASTAAPGASAQTATGQAAGGELIGLFRIDAASCSGSTVSGSYFRMIQPGGTPDGPYLSNTSSTCADQTYTDMQPGRDGGISTVDYQPQPDPPFTTTGGGQEGAADRITMPKEFFGSKYALATNPTDPQTNQPATLIKITHDGAGKLTGDTRAFAAAYQGQHFNQGAPKPDGSTPGATTLPTGTYDPATKRFAIGWTSTIVGGPFDNFTGKWHFEGVFEPAVADTPAAPAPTEETGTTETAAGPAPGTGTGTAGAPVAATPTGVMARTGPPWSAAVPAVLLGLAWAGRRLNRRPGEG